MFDKAKDGVAQMTSADEKLASCGAMFYDCEIVNMIPIRGEEIDPSFSYCGGWQDYSNMGISVVGVYDFVDRAYRVYLGDNINELSELIERRNIVIGYNNIRFDDNLLAANGIIVPGEKSYDLWAAIVATLPPTGGRRAGYKLNDMLKANDLEVKSGFGGDAPKLAQSGQWGKLMNYNLDDNRLGVKLLRLACNDVMKSPKTGSYMIIKKPWEAIKNVSSDTLF